MKNQILPSTLLTLCCLVFFSWVYTIVVWGVAQFAPNKGKGEIIQYGVAGKYGYANVGQSFTVDRYFWSRPSAVNYNAAGSGGSNKGPSNREYLAQVKTRIDTLLLHNPGIKKEQITADLVTASGSGLDPDISPGSVAVQIPRVARMRGVTEAQLRTLVSEQTAHHLIFGPARVNVLRLNLALDNLLEKK